MAKPAKTQWDFGDLFAGQDGGFAKPEESQQPAEPVAAAKKPNPAPNQKVLSVSELTTQIRKILEGQVGNVWVTGEITNLRFQGSGHTYFTLKDAGAQLGCVLFKGEYQVNRSWLQDGRKVLARGEVTVYEPRGQYQLRVTALELQGVGALQEAFERLKQKLNVEGLFAKERKRPLPQYPHRIGIVTSPTGAAIRDVIHVIERRDPSLEIVVAPCRVQGDGAGAEIAKAIGLLNDFNAKSAPGRKLDLILVTRGGGSLEDLWAFNEEVVARAIFNSNLPVVSAVGHEIDFTISDFVADVRAATPSAAAEIITEGVFSSYQFVSVVAGRMNQLARQQIENKRYELSHATGRLNRVHPSRKFNEWLQRLDDLEGSLGRCVRQSVRHQQVGWRNLAERLSRVRPALLVKQKRELLKQEVQRLKEQANHHVERLKNRVDASESRLRLLGPEQVLSRGYSITTDAETGKVLRDAKKAKAGQRLNTRLKNGAVESEVVEPQKG